MHTQGEVATLTARVHELEAEQAQLAPASSPSLQPPGATTGAAPQFSSVQSSSALDRTHSDSSRSSPGLTRRHRGSGGEQSIATDAATAAATGTSSDGNASTAAGVPLERIPLAQLFPVVQCCNVFAVEVARGNGSLGMTLRQSRFGSEPDTLAMIAVKSVVPETPAEKAGIEASDLVRCGCGLL